MTEKSKSVFYESRPTNQKGFVYNICPMFCEPFPQHVHDVAEFVHLTEGEAEFLVDGNRYALKPGDTIAIFPLVPHQYLRFSQDAKGLSVFLISNAIAEYQTVLTSLRPVIPVIGRSALREDAGYTLSRLNELMNKSEPAFDLAFVHLFLSHLFSVMKLKPACVCTDKNLAIRVIEYITANYQQPLLLQNTADALGISASHLSHLMSQQLGIGFRQYINTMRVNHAKTLIAETRMSMADIATQCGYTTQRSFNRAFLEVCGVTPGAYRAERVKRHLHNQLVDQECAEREAGGQ